MEWLKNLFRRKPEVSYLQKRIEDPDYDVMIRESGGIEIIHHPERKAQREVFNALTFEEKNEIGRKEGFGSCDHCGGRWNWKRGGRSIPTEKNRGYAGLCEECYESLSPQERYNYVVKHASRHGYSKEVNWDLVKKEVEG